MAEYICNLIEDNNTRKKMSQNSIIGMEKFKLEFIVNNWIQLIEGL